VSIPLGTAVAAPGARFLRDRNAGFFRRHVLTKKKLGSDQICTAVANAVPEFAPSQAASLSKVSLSSGRFSLAFNGACAQVGRQTGRL
jgi:hypothetical protein